MRQVINIPNPEVPFHNTLQLCLHSWATKNPLTIECILFLQILIRWPFHSCWGHNRESFITYLSVLCCCSHVVLDMADCHIRQGVSLSVSSEVRYTCLFLYLWHWCSEICVTIWQIALLWPRYDVARRTRQDSWGILLLPITDTWIPWVDILFRAWSRSERTLVDSVGWTVESISSQRERPR